MKEEMLILNKLYENIRYATLQRIVQNKRNNSQTMNLKEKVGNNFQKIKLKLITHTVVLNPYPGASPCKDAVTWLRKSRFATLSLCLAA